MNISRFSNISYRAFYLRFAAIIFPAALLIACGGGGEDGGSTTTTNQAPVASAGSNQSVVTGSQVTLDSSSSSDANNDSLTYTWSMNTVPSGSSASLDDSTSASPVFTADLDGSYIISLVVNDGTVSSTSDSVTVSSSTTTSSAYSYSIVDTDQTVCYNSSTGSTETCSSGTDADYSGNQPSYTLNSNGLTVTDNVTGLVWTQSTDINGDSVVDYDDKLSQSDAVSYCDTLILSGRSDWRLPNIKEAYSLILFSGEDASSYSGTDTSGLVLFIDDNYFDRAFGEPDPSIPEVQRDRIIDGQYASTTLYTSTTMNNNDTMFGVNYVDGRIKGYPTLTKEYYVRCVAGNTSYGVNDFTDNSDSTVSDNATGLMWQQDDTSSTDWEDAISTCEAATTASYTDWRLPNVKELQSIVDYSLSPDINSTAAIDPVFNATSFTNEEGITDWAYYWASTTHVDYNGDGSNATYVSFGRALGYMFSSILDVHGAGSQRSNDKLDVSTEPGASSATDGNGLFYYKGPQGDILREDNKVRCVRDYIAPYTLFAEIGSTETYLIDEAQTIVKTWTSTYNPGLSVYLLENGELLRTGSVSAGNRPTAFSGGAGGMAGVIEIIDWDNTVLWTTTVATDAATGNATQGYLSHHDVEVLPNGNILVVVWEAKTAAEAIALGRDAVSDSYLWAGAVYEICRSSTLNTCTDKEIVWSWSAWDHIVQDDDISISATYVTDVNNYPDQIDLNFYSSDAKDWTHINSVDYNADTDEILISVRGFSEYWVIDHSDTTPGILSRVGNPTAYGDPDNQVLFVQHDAQWIESGVPGAGNILVFNNGQGRPAGNYSSVDEFCYSNAGCSTAGELVNSYSEGISGTFYADHISGAQRLPNGNTLVCEGTEGRVFEYDSTDTVIWDYTHGANMFRATRYYSDYAGLSEL